MDSLCVAIEDLATKGPQKPEELRGLNNYEQYGDDLTVQGGLKKMPPKVGTRYKEDSTHHRTGWLLDEQITETMLKHIGESKKLLHKDEINKKEAHTAAEYIDQINMLKGVIMIAYPAFHGLGEWEPARVLIEAKMDSDKGYYIQELHDALKHEETSVWWAGKELAKDKPLFTFSGKNNNTKIVCRFQKVGAGAPVREPLIDEDTHKKMLAYYYKKTEESKKLEQDSDDQYLNAPWANSKNLKNDLYGIKDIKWKH
jgi:hypothetical protein